MLLASYGSHEDSPLEPDGVALVWNSRFLASGQDSPPLGMCCQYSIRIFYTFTIASVKYNAIWNDHMIMISSSHYILIALYSPLGRARICVPLSVGSDVGVFLAVPPEPGHRRHLQRSNRSLGQPSSPQNACPKDALDRQRRSHAPGESEMIHVVRLHGVRDDCSLSLVRSGQLWRKVMIDYGSI